MTSLEESNCDNFSIDIYESTTGTFRRFKSKDLAKYPESNLTLNVKFNNECPTVIKYPFNSKTLEMIHYFYVNDKWQNPFYYSNRMMIQTEDDNSITNFDEICDYLNLPNTIEDADESSVSEDSYDLGAIENDFYVYGEDPSDIEYDYDYDFDDCNEGCYCDEEDYGKMCKCYP